MRYEAPHAASTQETRDEPEIPKMVAKTLLFFSYIDFLRHFVTAMEN